MTDRHTKVRASQILDGSLKNIDLADEAKTSIVAFVIDGGGLEIGTGFAGSVPIPFNCEIQEVILLADQSGDIVINIFKDTYENYLPTTSIVASAKPTISSDIKSFDNTLVGWTKTIIAGDIIMFNVDSITTIERCTISLKIVKT